MRKRNKYWIMPVGWHPDCGEPIKEAEKRAVIRTKPPKELNRYYQIIKPPKEPPCPTN